MRHAEEAMSRWPLNGLDRHPPLRRITPGENIVLVLTASQHRQAAFERPSPDGLPEDRARRSGSARKARQETLQDTLKEPAGSRPAP